jgi:SPP1 family predicted phage head-tail adaptor
MTTTDIGKLHTRVTLKKPVRVADDSGGASETLTTIADCWADVHMTIGNRGQDASKTVIGRTAKMVIRANPDIIEDLTNELMVVALGKTWKVQGFMESDNRLFYEFIIATQ